MKTGIATILFAVGMLCSGIALANEPVPASKEVSKSVAELINDNIKYPEFARAENFECCVLIRLIIQGDGSFEVDCVNCKDDRLKAHVLETVKKIMSEEHAQYAGQKVSIKVNFKFLAT